MTRQSGARIAEVAADAGVSPTTVSHALSGKRAVSADTRARIERSVERLGYRPNLVAKGLRSQRTHSVALLVADISNPYYPELARSVGDVLTVDGYLPFICNTDGAADRERTFLHEAMARSVDGVIIQAMSLRPAEVRQIVGDRTPLVVLGDGHDVSASDQVSTDDAMGIREAVAHLLSNGRTDLAFVTGPEGNGPSPARLAAFRAAMGEAGLTVRDDRAAHTAFTRDGGATAATRMLDAADAPQAILCANDLIAIGVMDVVRARGLRIPEDVAVVGFDNIETADLVTPRLTTIDNYAAAVGAAAASALLQRMTDGGATPFRSIALPTRLVIRESA